MINTRLSGGMGNQMFQYAIGRALSLKHNVPLALDVTFLNDRTKMPEFLRPHFAFRSFDLDVFALDAKIADPQEISFWNRPFFSGKLMLVIDAVFRKLAFLPGWEKKFSFDERILALGPNAYLAGFWQSEKYFLEVQDQIRKDFALKEKMSENAQKLSIEIQNTASLCVHVRRADMAAWKSFHGSCDLAYYERGIAYVSKNTNIEKVYVFSDDILWCEQNMHFPCPTVFVSKEYSGKKGEGHLALMSLCKHFIIPNSTFSWWAAWLSNNPDKIVVAPKAWFSNSINTKDLIPKSWIRM